MSTLDLNIDYEEVIINIIRIYILKCFWTD